MRLLEGWLPLASLLVLCFILHKTSAIVNSTSSTPGATASGSFGPGPTSVPPAYANNSAVSVSPNGSSAATGAAMPAGNGTATTAGGGAAMPAGNGTATTAGGGAAMTAGSGAAMTAGNGAATTAGSGAAMTAGSGAATTAGSGAATAAGTGVVSTGSAAGGAGTAAAAGTAGINSAGTVTGSASIGSGTVAGATGTYTTPSVLRSNSSTVASAILSTPVTQAISLRFTDISGLGITESDALFTKGTPTYNNFKAQVEASLDAFGKATMPSTYVANTAHMFACYQGSVIANVTFNTTSSTGANTLANNLQAAGSNGLMSNVTLDTSKITTADPPQKLSKKVSLAEEHPYDIANYYIPDRAVINPPYLTLITLPSLLGLLVLIGGFMIITAGKDACLCRICDNNQAKAKTVP